MTLATPQSMLQAAFSRAQSSYSPVHSRLSPHHLIQAHVIKYHPYADDSQIYTSIPHFSLSFKLLYPTVYSLPLIYLTNNSKFMYLKMDSRLYLSWVTTNSFPNLPTTGNGSTVHTDAWNPRVLLLTYCPFHHSHIQSINKFFPFFPSSLKCISFSSSPMPSSLFQPSSLLQTTPVVS